MSNDITIDIYFSKTVLFLDDILPFFLFLDMLYFTCSTAILRRALLYFHQACAPCVCFFPSLSSTCVFFSCFVAMYVCMYVYHSNTNNKFYCIKTQCPTHSGTFDSEKGTTTHKGYVSKVTISIHLCQNLNSKYPPKMRNVFQATCEMHTAWWLRQLLVSC